MCGELTGSGVRWMKPLDLEAAADDFVMKDGNFGANAKGLFGWANNNPSSKSAIYDTEFIQSAAVRLPCPSL